MRRWIWPALLALTLWTAPRPAWAAINCSISTVGVAFGSYNVFSGAVLTSTGSVTIRCTGVGAGIAPVSVFLNPGLSGSVQPRKMISGAERLSYNLYLDSSGADIWGDGTAGTQQYTGMLTNNRTVNITVFGRIPPGQDVAIGTYSDTIVATINF
ncbi:MAG TPA: spore coat U domain-containing protein [Nitrospira sp.]|nr:spore coat U domain-containing protein [Nitrospira sp.]